MFFLKTLTHKIQLHPSYFGPSLSDYCECAGRSRAQPAARKWGPLDGWSSSLVTVRGAAFQALTYRTHRQCASS